MSSWLAIQIWTILTHFGYTNSTLRSQIIQILSSNIQNLKKFLCLEWKCLLITKAYLMERNYIQIFITHHVRDEYYQPAIRKHVAWKGETWHLIIAVAAYAINTFTPLLQSNLVIQSPTTPGQFDMWQNADVPRSGVLHPMLIESSGTEHYYTGEFDMWQNADIPSSDVHPLANQT